MPKALKAINHKRNYIYNTLIIIHEIYNGMKSQYLEQNFLNVNETNRSKIQRNGMILMGMS